MKYVEYEVTATATKPDGTTRHVQYAHDSKRRVMDIADQWATGNTVTDEELSEIEVHVRDVSHRWSPI